MNKGDTLANDCIIWYPPSLSGITYLAMQSLTIEHILGSHLV